MRAWRFVGWLALSALLGGIVFATLAILSIPLPGGGVSDLVAAVFGAGAGVVGAVWAWWLVYGGHSRARYAPIDGLQSHQRRR